MYCQVAPYVGAWIETSTTKSLLVRLRSHPTWVRGLKLVDHQLNFVVSRVAPYVGAWIETKNTCTVVENFMSHPTWVRGLKLVFRRF